MKNILILLVLLTWGTTRAKGQNTIFWEVNDTINNKKSYLLGTCHTIGASFLDRYDVIEKALKESSTVVFEVLEEDEASNHIMRHRQRSDSLLIILTRKEYSQLKSINPTWTDDFLQKLEPLELTIKLVIGISMQLCGHYSKNDAMIYLDSYLEQLSKRYGIKTVGLETGSDQVEVLEMLPKKSWSSERKGIKALIKISKKRNYPSDLCKYEQSYINLGLPYHFGEPCPDDPLLTVRNEKWMPKLITLLSSENCFVAVGQLHLAYDCGLIVRLKEKGYLITPISLE